MKRFLKHNATTKGKTGAHTKHCKLCGNPHAHIQKYQLHLCRRCFRDTASKLGFKKYN